MAKRVPIKFGSVGSALTLLGTLYRNPADAVKEYTSNAIDEWVKQTAKGGRPDVCRVTYSLEKSRIVIEYNCPGMDEKEFEAALRRVADSAKKTLTIAQIGELGIGIFAFNQVGRTCTFWSKKLQGSQTVKVTLRSGSDEAEIETAPKKEALAQPGMRIVISNLHTDPTKGRGPLEPERLQRMFAEKFDPYLRAGQLEIMLCLGTLTHMVQPLDLGLPTVGKGYETRYVEKDARKTYTTQFWFDPSGKGKVSIRHTGVTIIDDMGDMAYGFEDTVYGSGFLRGYIDAVFLRPLPSRTAFEENNDWATFLLDLQRIEPAIAAEVQELRKSQAQEQAKEVLERAKQLASEILGQPIFQDLELLKGLAKKRGKRQKTGKAARTGRRTGERSRTSGNKPSPEGLRFNWVEKAFETGPEKHSRFVTGTVEANFLNSDYKREMAGREEDKLAYAALLIGKETIAYNDKSGKADDLLEKLLAFSFQLKLRVPEHASALRRQQAQMAKGATQMSQRHSRGRRAQPASQQLNLSL